jgi:hypothetical protein
MDNYVEKPCLTRSLLLHFLFMAAVVINFML